MYRVTCVSCSKPFDAEQAAECSCIQPVRSFRCPNCAACFCSAGKDVLNDFWRNATPELWKRRNSSVPPTPENASPEEIERPMVLFADDDPVGRAIAVKLIKSLGIGIAVAENGEAALEMARLYKPELIVTDAMMPRLDGRDLSRIIKEELPATKVVVITSVYKDPRYKHEARKNFGVDDYLNKPVSPAELRAVVIKHIKNAVPPQPPR